MTREELLRILDELEGAATPAGPKGEAVEGEPGVDARPGPPNPGFWRAGVVPEDVFPEPAAAQQPGALLLRLGAFPFWRGPEPLTEALLPVYERAAAAALDVLADLTRKG